MFGMPFYLLYPAIAITFAAAFNWLQAKPISEMEREIAAPKLQATNLSG
jgi:hypothetical protein